MNDDNSGQVFVPITNKDVYFKLLELERAVNDLKIKVYAGSAALVIITTFFTVTGGLSLGA